MIQIRFITLDGIESQEESRPEWRPPPAIERAVELPFRPTTPGEEYPRFRYAQRRIYIQEGHTKDGVFIYRELEDQRLAVLESRSLLLQTEINRFKEQCSELRGRLDDIHKASRV